jgi:hypothetical protein
MATTDFDHQIDDDIRLIALRALLGLVPVSLRAFSVQVIQKTVSLRSIFDESASNSDIELLRHAGAKIIAEYPLHYILEEDYWLTSATSKITHLEDLIFLRHDSKGPT